MTKDFGGTLANPNKNKLATGGGAENADVKEEKEITLEKTTHITVHITGPDADRYNWISLLAPSEGENYEITSCNVNTYYTKKKE